MQNGGMQNAKRRDVGYVDILERGASRVARFRSSEVAKEKHLVLKKKNKKCPQVKTALVDSLIMVSLLAATLAIFFLVEPRHVGFVCNDPKLIFSYKSDTISTGTLLAICIAIPLILTCTTELLYNGIRRDQKTIVKKIRVGLLSFSSCMFGFVTNMFAVEITKSALGKHRPHFLAVCSPDSNYANCTNTYIPSYQCTNDRGYSASVVRDAFRSLPSGHASACMYTAVFVSIYLQKRMKVSFSNLLKPTIQILLVSLALFVSVTRVTDDKHHMVDIYVGWVFGVTSAVFTFNTLIVPAALVENKRGQPVEKTHSMLTTYSTLSQDSEPVTPLTPAPLVFAPSPATDNIISID